MRNYNYLKKYETAVKREVAIRYAKAQADKLNKPLIHDSAVVQKEKNSFIKEESNKLLLDAVFYTSSYLQFISKIIFI